MKRKEKRIRELATTSGKPATRMGLLTPKLALEQRSRAVVRSGCHKLALTSMFNDQRGQRQTAGNSPLVVDRSGDMDPGQGGSSGNARDSPCLTMLRQSDGTQSARHCEALRWAA